MAADTDPRITLQDCMRGAFAALLRGDTKERDRLCDLAMTAFGDGTDAGAESMPLDTPISDAALTGRPDPAARARQHKEGER